MSDSTKKGRKPLTSKKKSVDLNPDTVFTNRLMIPEGIQATAEKNGWELRWVDAKELYTNGGQHKNGWIPYIQPKDEAAKDNYGFKFGNDPDGVVRRTSVILAYRPVDQGEKHRNYLKLRATKLAGSYNKDAANEFRKQAKQENINVEVIEGFDENE